MPDGDFVNVRVGTPSGGVLYFVQPGTDTGNGYAIYQAASALQFRSGPAGYVFKNYTNVTRVTIGDDGLTTIQASHNTPLALQAAASLTSSATIQFRKYSGAPSWTFGAGVTSGVSQDFGLYDHDSAIWRLYIGTNGNICLGSQGPTSRLTVDSAVTQASDNISTLYSAGRTAGIGIGFQDVRQLFANQPLHLNAGTGAPIYVGSVSSGTVNLALAGGNVAIGSVTPQARLHVGGTAAVDGNVGIGRVPTAQSERLAVAVDNSDTTNIAAFYAQNETAGVGIGYQEVRQIKAGQSLRLNAGAGGMIYLGNVSAAGVSLASAGGNVGIGTPTPEFRLDVQGGQSRLKSADNSPLTLDAGAAATPFSAVIRFRKSDGTPSWTLGAGALSGTQQEFGLYDQINGAWRLYVGPTGSVGFGTTSPGAKLDATGTIRSTAQTIPPSGAGAELLYTAAQGGQPAQGTLTTYNRDAGGGYQRLNLDGSTLILNNQTGTGNVGIGTPDPQARLHVDNGEILSTGDPTQGRGRVSARQFWGLNSSGAGHLVADFNGCYYAP